MLQQFILYSNEFYFTEVNINQYKKTLSDVNELMSQLEAQGSPLMVSYTEGAIATSTFS